jgi:hypothetical protein
MGYNCAAAINLKVNGIESQKLNKGENEFLKKELANLRSRQVLIKKMKSNISFFDGLNYYLSFTIDKNKVSEHSKLGTLFSYKGTYQLEQYIFEDENYAGSPIEILELYIISFSLSKQYPDSKIELGIGDAAFFWSDLELKNGEIVKISSEYGEDDIESTGFICNDFEIRQLFLGLNYLWLEENKSSKADLENYFHQKNNEIFLAEYEENPFLFEDAEEWMKKDRELVLKLVKKAGYVLEYVHESLKSDKEIVLEALKSSSSALQYSSDEFKKDRELVLSLVKRNGSILEYADETLKADKEIALAAVNSEFMTFTFISDELKKDRDIVLIVLQNDIIGELRNYLDKDFLKDISLLKQAIVVNPDLFRYVETSIKSNKELALLAINQDGLLLKYCGNTLKDDFDLVMKAVQNNGLALEFASEKLKKDTKIVKQAIKQSGEASNFAADNFTD